MSSEQQAGQEPPSSGVRQAFAQELRDIILTEKEIAGRVRELARLITQDYQGKQPLLVTVLKGGTVFLADLMRQIELPLTVDFIAISSYGSATDTTGVVRFLKDLDEPIAGQDVLVVEDIIDTGLTLNYLVKNLRSRDPASLKVCTLLDRPHRRIADLEMDYLGFEIPDIFVVGYGLDYAGRYRNLPYIARYPLTL